MANTIIEKEVRGYIDQVEFVALVNRFKTQFENYKFTKRLSITLADYDKLDVETKIRITNGKTEVTQKLGDFTAVNREEITIHMNNPEASDILNLYKSYKNFLKDAENPMLTLIQHENHIFENDKFEVKLFRQFGNSEFYAFEVESLIDMEDEELEKYCDENNLKVDPNYNDYESVQKRNTEVNIDLVPLEDSKFLDIIEQYLRLN